ncbi:phosphatase PAP2 family protein [Streptomyces sp. NPDC056411]|uniref:phosphatase PAP2 family protein n=1 Tax=Streptomyces sp. NPDC056411 TaxID=3345813 RepID=UPI0035DBC9AB
MAGHGPLRTLDERLGRAVSGSEFPSSVAEFLADLGNTAVAVPALLVVMVWAGWRGWRHSRQEGRADGKGPARWWLPPLAAGLALAAVPALVVPLKLWLARPGPPQMAGGAHAGFYPSGHGATAAVAYGVAALLVLGSREGGRPIFAGGRRAAGVLVGAVALLNAGVGLGLVRRGYHWPLDVLGSWCLAGVLLAAWCAVCGVPVDGVRAGGVSVGDSGSGPATARRAAVDSGGAVAKGDMTG